MESISPKFSRLTMILIVVAALSFSACPLKTESGLQRSFVERVADGDTIVLRDGEGGFLTARLYGIDAPEIGQPFGSEARSALKRLILNRHVRYRRVETDRYGRLVAVIIMPDGRNVGEELVRGGYAWWFRKFAVHERELRDLEQRARAERKGLWERTGAIEPWRWRERYPRSRSKSL